MKTYASQAAAFNEGRSDGGSLRKTHTGKARTTIDVGAATIFLRIAPTLELCSQIKTEIDFLSPAALAAPLPSALLIGSASIDKQIELKSRVYPKELYEGQIYIPEVE